MKHFYKPLFILFLLGGMAAMSYFVYQGNKIEAVTELSYYKHQLDLKEKYGHLAEEDIKKLPKQDRPDLAMLQEFEMTKDHTLGYPPTHRKIAAFQYAKSLSENKSNVRTGISNLEWDERGPDNIGGRTRALMWDPNDVNNKKAWAGGVGGGLWFNTDVTTDATSWQSVDDLMANLAITTLAFDPSNTQVFYMGTGEGFNNADAIRGGGIWKTTDGGANWNHLSSTDAASTSDFHYVQKIVVTTNGTVLAATLNGLFRSTDGGTNWSNPAGISGSMADLEIAADGDIFVGSFSGDISRSSDDGVNFSSMLNTSNARVELATASSNSDVIYALFVSGLDVNDFKKSIDGGSNWTDITIPVYTTQSCTLSGSDDFTRNQAWYDLIMAVHPSDANKVIVGGIDLYKSTDSGSNWGLISYWTGGCDTFVHADQHAIRFRPGNPDEAIFGNDGGVFYSADVGSASDPTIDDRNNGYNVTQYYACAVQNEVGSTYFLAGAQDNGTQQYTSAGINSTVDINGGDGAFCFIDQDEPDLQIASYVYNNYSVSTNSFTSSSNLGVQSNDGRFINPADYDSKQNILYAAGNSGELIRYSGIPSSIQTTTLSTNTSNTISNILVSPYTDNKLYVGTGSGDVYMVQNADQATPIYTSLRSPDGNYISSIDLGESENDILLTISNYGETSVYLSTDGGSSWIDKEDNLPDMPVRWGIFNPKNYDQVILATEVGVWSTTDINGTSPGWEPNNDTGLANVRCDMLQYRESDGLLAVATHGRGLFTTTSLADESIASFSVSSSNVFVGSTINFTNASVGQINNSYWNFGDGYSSTAFEPTHTYNVPGTYTVNLGINNGSSNAQNEIIVTEINHVPYTTSDGGDFETNQDDFYPDNLSGTPFELGNSSITGKDGTNSGSNAWVIGLEDANYADGTHSILNSPNFDFSAAGTYDLSFFAKYQLEIDAGGAWDAFWVEYSTDDGTSWTRLGDGTEPNWYNEIVNVSADVLTPGDPVFGGTSSTYTQYNKDISSLATNARVAFRIIFRADNATGDIGLAIDDFVITAPQSDAVSDFSSTNPNICEGNSVTFYENSSGTVSAYSWAFGANASPTTATGPGPHEVVYATAGNYDVSLTATGVTNGDVIETKVSYVTVTAATSIDNTVTTGSNELNACSSTGVDITIVSSNVGVQYQAFDNATGFPLGGYEIGDGSDIVLNTGLLTVTTTVNIIATSASGCESVLSTSPVITFAGPDDKTVTSDYLGAVCSDDIVTFTIVSSDNSVTYQLLDISDDSLVGSSVVGDGFDIIINTGAVSATLTVKLIGTLNGTTCVQDIGSELEIEVKPLPDVALTDSGTRINVPSGSDAYQWYLDGIEITGSTGNSYTPTYAGSYTVEVTLNGCTATSAAHVTSVTGLEEFISGVKIYPNPSFDGIFTLASPLSGEVNIYSTAGKMIYHNNLTFGENSIDLTNYNSGIYIMEIKQGDTVIKERISLIK